MTDFDIDKSDNCSKDYVEIIDPILNEILWRGCGHLPNETVFTSKRNELTIRLVSDGFGNAKGFIGNYSINCGGRVVANESGEFIYRRANYGKDCIWTIIAEDPSKHVTLTFSYMTLFYSGNPEDCVSQVEVYEGVAESLGAKRSSFCSGKVPSSIVSNGNALTIKINSSGFSTLSEFDIHYSLMENGKNFIFCISNPIQFLSY